MKMSPQTRKICIFLFSAHLACQMCVGEPPRQKSNMAADGVEAMEVVWQMLL